MLFVETTSVWIVCRFIHFIAPNGVQPNKENDEQDLDDQNEDMYNQSRRQTDVGGEVVAPPVPPVPDDSSDDMVLNTSQPNDESDDDVLGFVGNGNTTQGNWIEWSSKWLLFFYI